MGLIRKVNLGYAFANFTNTVRASRFWKVFNKYKWNIGSNRKTREVYLLTIHKTSTREIPLCPPL